LLWIAAEKSVPSWKARWREARESRSIDRLVRAAHRSGPIRTATKPRILILPVGADPIPTAGTAECATRTGFSGRLRHCPRAVPQPGVKTGRARARRACLACSRATTACSRVTVGKSPGTQIAAARLGGNLHRREDARVRLRPEGVVFALRDAATDNTSFPVGKFRRTRDTTIMTERRRSDLHD
jgi:hypothetical protein